MSWMREREGTGRQTVMIKSIKRRKEKKLRENIKFRKVGNKS